MPIAPLITFKAGICEVDQTQKPYKVKPSPRPGYIYLYSEDDLIHFCWRERSQPMDNAELDLVMVPSDGHFTPVESSPDTPASHKTQGRIFILKFQSSSQRHMFWLQSSPQGPANDPTYLSPRDRKIGEIVDELLQGEEVDVNAELASVRNGRSGGGAGAEDETMEDVEGHGNAGAGDIRQEGEGDREGGADGARGASTRAAAPPEDAASAAVRNLLASLNNTPGLAQPPPSSAQGKIYPLLSDLLDTPTTVPMIKSAPEVFIDSLLSYMPPVILVMSQQASDIDDVPAEPTQESSAAAIAAMSLAQKRNLLEKVLRSPQFHQSLTSLSMALRDGGLPSISDALGVKVENGGMIRGGNMPLGGGEAVEAFVEGVKTEVKKK